MTGNGIQFASPGSIESYVLLATHSAQRALETMQELESTLRQTRDRIQQSRQKLAISDLLIGDLANLICLGSPQQPTHR